MNPAGERIRSWAAELGFEACRFARANTATHAAVLQEWLTDGCHGDMQWMERDPARRCDPREVLPGCRTVICLAVNYFPGNNPRTEGPPPPYRIARYAWNDDYHTLIQNRLRELVRLLDSLGGTHRPYVDTGPVLERDFASDAGLGWNGKSTMQIHRRLGTWFFLAEVLTTLEIDPDPPFGDHCGKCVRCMSACPTGAITAPHRLDARRCISYLTIEHKGPIPVELREAVGDRIYGCDDCLDACPWNRFAETSRETAFHARKEIFDKQPRDFLALDDDAFRALFKGSPIKRIKRSRFLRNVCVALGNTGGPEDLPALRLAAQDADPLIAEHANWAVETILAREAKRETQRMSPGA
jgi:epoxyqueuosine reductase